MPILTLPSPGASLSIRAKALVFEDPRSQALLARIEQVAPSEATVLVTGETGTGKEIVARQIHQLSRRAEGAFVAVNCGAFSENLVESELFGHERGAFTGALQSKAGWFEAARGGTLFLDEVGDLPLSVQVKLLRVLQENEVVRVGSRHAIPVNVRLIAATNVDLQEAMSAGRFREDLFYRLNVVSIGLPPLRERPGDIPALARYFVEMYQRRLGVDPVHLSADAIARLLAHSWPGNIRELENTMHHALLVCLDNRIDAQDIRITTAPTSTRSRSSSPPAPVSETLPLRQSNLEPFQALENIFLELFELGMDQLHERIDDALMRTAYSYSEQNQLQTARLLGISRNVVRARLIQHGHLAGRLRGGADPEHKALEKIKQAASVIATRGGRSQGLGVEELSDAPLTLRPSLVRLGTPTVRIGYQRFGRLLLVKALGRLDAELSQLGVRVEWLEFAGGPQLIDALHAGDVDMGVVGECPPLLAQAAATPIVYLASEVAAPETEAILVPKNSTLTNVADLRGRTIAVTRGANVHYLLIRALEEAGLGYHDVDVAFLSPEDAESAFERGLLDAWALWDPLLTSVRRKHGARTLRDSRGLSTNTTYYVARRSVAETNPDWLEIVLASVEHTTRIAQADLPATAQLLERESGMPAQVLQAWISGLGSLSSIGQAVLSSQQAIADHLYGLNLMPQPIRVTDALCLRNAVPQVA